MGKKAAIIGQQEEAKTIKEILADAADGVVSDKNKARAKKLASKK